MQSNNAGLKKKKTYLDIMREMAEKAAPKPTQPPPAKQATSTESQSRFKATPSVAAAPKPPSNTHTHKGGSLGAPAKTWANFGPIKPSETPSIGRTNTAQPSKVAQYTQFLRSKDYMSAYSTLGKAGEDEVEAYNQLQEARESRARLEVADPNMAAQIERRLQQYSQGVNSRLNIGGATYGELPYDQALELESNRMKYITDAKEMIARASAMEKELGIDERFYTKPYSSLTPEERELRKAMEYTKAGTQKFPYDFSATEDISQLLENGYKNKPVTIDGQWTVLNQQYFVDRRKELEARISDLKDEDRRRNMSSDQIWANRRDNPEYSDNVAFNIQGLEKELEAIIAWESIYDGTGNAEAGREKWLADGGNIDPIVDTSNTTISSLSQYSEHYINEAQQRAKNEKRAVSDDDIQRSQTYYQQILGNAYRLGVTSGNADLGIPLLNDVERELYFTLYDRDGKEAANTWLYDTMRFALNKRASEYAAGAQALRSTDGVLGTVGSTAASVLMTPAKIPGALYSFWQQVNNQMIDPNAAVFGPTRYVSTVRDTQTDAIIKKYGKGTLLGEGFKFLYAAGTSAADSTLLAMLGGGMGLGSVGTTVMHSTAGSSDSMLDAFDRGGSQDQAVGMLVASLLAETATELAPMDFLFRGFSEGFSLKGLIREMGSEALGEGTSEILTTIADRRIMLDKSQYDMAVKSYRAGGMSQEQAERAALNDVVGNALYAAGVGAAAGGGSYVMAGAQGSLLNRQIASKEAEYAKLESDALEAAARERMDFETRDGEAAKKYSELVKLATDTLPAESATRALITKEGPIDTKRMEAVAKGALSEYSELLKANPSDEVAGKAQALNKAIDALYVGIKTDRDTTVDKYTAGLDEAVKSEIKGKTGEEAASYAKGYGIAHALGQIGVPNDTIAKATGFKDAKKAAEEGRAKWDIELPKAKNKAAELRKTLPLPGKGSVTYHSNVKQDALTTGQRDQIGLLEKVAEPMGYRFVMVEFEKDAAGNYVTDKGQIAPNGYFRDTDGTIYIDVNAGKTAGRMVEDTIIPQTAGHELTHYLKANAPDLFRAYGAAVIDELIAKGQDINALIAQKIGRAKQSSIGAEAALEEVIADSSAMMLQNTQAVQKMAETNPGLFQKITEWVKDFIESVRKAFSKVEGTPEAKAIMSMRDGVMKYADSLQKMWDDMAVSVAQARVKEEAERPSVEGIVRDGLNRYADEAVAASERDADVKFQMREPVEETAKLIAVHNLNEAQLLSSVELGGFAMPSIAVIKAGQPHDRYGDISIVFGKETIDPKNRKNKVYGGDAWTPSFPQINHEISGDSTAAIRKKVSGLLGELYKPFDIQLSDDSIKRAADNNRGSFADAYENEPGLMGAYLKSIGEDFIPYSSEPEYAPWSGIGNEAVKYLADKMGGELQAAYNKPFDEKMAMEPAIRGVINEYFEQQYSDTLSKKQLREMGAEEYGFNKIDEIIRGVGEYLKTKGAGRLDKYETGKMLRRRFAQDNHLPAYRAWLDELFADAISKRGIRNNADIFTPSGNRRSFSATHWAVTLENVVRVMRSQDGKGSDSFGSSGLFGVSTKNYSSLDDIRKDIDRLQQMDEEQYKAKKDEFQNRIVELANEIAPKTERNRFIALDNAAEVLTEAARKGTTAGIQRVLNGYKDYYNIREDTAKKLYQLMSDISRMPTEYFEAKPERAVGFDEVRAVIIPDTASDELKKALDNMSATVIEYKAEDNADRLKALNSPELDGVKFQERDTQYLAAVESGDMDTAQKMVDEAAKAAGYTIRAYHGTPYGGFTIFRDESYFTENKEYADIYQNPSASSVRGRYDAASNPMTYEVYLNITRPFDTRNATERRIFTDEFYRKYGTGTPLSERGLPDWTDGTDLIEFIQENGLDYDGIILDEGGTGGYGEEVKLRGLSYVPLEPEQIKSADPVTYDDAGNPIPLSQRFTDSNDIRYQERDPVPPMYSKMAQEIEAYKGDKMGADSVVKYLQGRGVKADEIRWSGIVPFLQGKKSVSKAELLEFAKASALDIKDVTKKGPDISRAEWNYWAENEAVQFEADQDENTIKVYSNNITTTDIAYDDNSEVYIDDVTDREFENWDDAIEYARDQQASERNYWLSGDAYNDSVYSGSDGPKYDDYSLEDGRWYREILFTAPKLSGNFQSSHWRGNKNVLAHTRLQDFQTTDGKPVLFIEEIQSDWHERGREEGYYHAIGDVTIEQYKPLEYIPDSGLETAVVKDSSGNIVANINKGKAKETGDVIQYVAILAPWLNQESGTQRFQTEQAALDYVKSQRSAGIAPAPFATTWHEYVLKRVLRMAAEGGYDYVGWTTGQMQADRYWGNAVISDAVDRFIEVTKPESVRVLADNIFGGKMAGLMPLNVMDGGMLTAAQNDKVRDVIISNLPVDVMDILSTAQLSPEDIFRNEDVVFNNLPVGSRTRVASAVLGTLRDTGATIRTKLEGLSLGGGEILLFPTLKASDLNSREVAGLLSPRIYHFDASSLPKEGTSTGTTAKTLPREERGSLGENLSATKLAELLNAHVSIIHDNEGLVKHGFEAPQGEGMKNFYDIGGKSSQNIPRFLNKYGAQWGAKISTIDMQGAENTYQVPAIEVTDAMKESVLYEGQPLYQERDLDYRTKRDILAGAFDSVAKTEGEKRNLKEYKNMIGALNRMEEEARGLRQANTAERKKPDRDKAVIEKNTKRIAEIEDRINNLDKRLLKMQNAAPLQNVLKREVDYYKKQQNALNKQQLEKYRAGRAETAMKQRYRGDIIKGVKSLNTMLVNESDKKHIPEGFKGAVVDFLKLFTDNTSVFDYKRLSVLKDMYDALATSDSDLAGMYEFDIAGDIADAAQMLEGKRLSQLTESELESLRDIVAHFNHIVKNENLIHTQKRSVKTTDAAEEGLSEYGKKAKEMRLAILNGKNPIAAINKFLTSKNVKPVYFFKRVGGILQELFDDVRAGQGKWAFQMAKDRAFFRNSVQKYNYYKWIDDGQLTFTTARGDQITLTRDQALELYAIDKREKTNEQQGAEHLAIGGFVYEDAVKVKKKSALGVPMTYEDNVGETHPLTDSDLDQINEWLTDEQRAFADEMVNYLSTDMGERGNEVSMALYGIRKYTEKYYFPYKSASNYLNSHQGGVQDDSAIKHRSFTKRTTVSANNPVVLTGFTKVWADHVQNMNLYNAMAVPLDNFNRVYNYQLKGDRNDNKPKSVKAVIEAAYGKEANAYIKQLLNDINGGIRPDKGDAEARKMMSLWKKGAVFASLSVVVQQPSAIGRALALVDAKYFRKGYTKAGYDEMMKWSGVANIKAMGRFDANMGMTAAGWLTQREYTGMDEKAKAFAMDGSFRDDVLSWLPQKADEMTWTALWEAVKRETASKHGNLIGSDAFMQKVAERFDEVVDYTQVYDSVLSRSEVMRSQSALAQMVTAFMAEPTTAYNMLLDSIANRKNKGMKNYVKPGRALGAFAVSVMLNSILKAMVTAGRDDDEKYTYLEKYLRKVSGGIADELNPLGLVPYGRDILSLWEGYDIERADMSLAGGLVDAVKKMGKADMPLMQKADTLAGAIGNALGIPYKNVRRDIQGIYNVLASSAPLAMQSASGAKYSLLEGLPWFDASRAGYARKLYSAITNGDKRGEAELREQISKIVKKDSDINTELRKIITTEFEEERLEPRIALQQMIDLTELKEIKGKIGDWYKTGLITEDVAEQLLVEFTADDQPNERYKTIEGWNFSKNPDNEGERYSTYKAFYEAIDSGKDLRTVVNTYMDPKKYGATKSTLSGRITDNYKEQYIETYKRSKSEAAALKARLLNAYVLLGYDRDKKSKDIDAWLK